MNLIKQPDGSSLCGQTCVAMIAGISLDESIALFGTRGGTTTKQVVSALRKLGIQCGDKCERIQKGYKPESCMCVLHFKDCKFTHWVVYLDGLYYDPACGIGNIYPDGIRVTSYLPINIPDSMLNRALNTDLMR